MKKLPWRTTTLFAALLAVMTVASSMTITPAHAATPIDVYLIAGQSNAVGFAADAATGQSSKNYELHFASSANSSNPDFISQEFKSSTLDNDRAVTILADKLQEDSTDIAIFGYAHGATAINPAKRGAASSWYPGDDPQNGEFYNDGLYGSFRDWTNNRLDDLVEDGYSPTVRGIFWYQGEADLITPRNEYQTMLESVIFRMRADFGNDLPVVVTNISHLQVSENEVSEINNAINAVAASDNKVAVTDATRLGYRDQIHLSDYSALAEPWAASMSSID